MTRFTVLENGLRVVTAELPHMASSCVGVWAGTGSRHEPEPIGGIAHFIEHLAFKGTRKRTAREITDSVEGAGGYLNAFTAEENTCYYARVHHRRTLDALDVLVDMFMNARFAPAEIEKERSVIRDEIAMYYDQPSQYVLELLNETVWPKHPLGRPITGTVETLNAIQRRDILGFHKRHYGPGNTLIAAAGRVSHDQILRKLRRATKGIAIAPATSVERSDPERQERANINLHKRDCEQVQIAIGIRCCSRHDKRRTALKVLNTILGENMSSRLWHSLREKHGLAYNIYSSIGLFDDDGSLTISAGVETDAAVEAFELICHELGRLVRRAPAAKEVSIAKDYLIGQLDLNLEHTENHMMSIGEQVLGYGRVFSPSSIKAAIRRIDADDIVSTARDFFRKDRFNLALVGPLKSDRAFRRAIDKHLP